MTEFSFLGELTQVKCAQLVVVRCATREVLDIVDCRTYILCFKVYSVKRY